MTRSRKIFVALAWLLLTVGVLRFIQTGVLPALHLALGDFRASFPTASLAWLRPDFPTDRVWPGWTYGPMLHFLTLPLFLAPRWSMVPPIWALTNLIAISASFVFACRISGVRRQVSGTTIVWLAALWLWFKPLQICFGDGNIELVEMAITLAALDALSRNRLGKSGVLLGAATMIKFAPVGFLGWLALRRQWRAVTAGIMTILAIAVVTQMTLGFQNNGLALRSLWDRGVPQVNADTQSVTSVFLHGAGQLDHTDLYYPQRWFPTARASAAALSGELACVLLGVVYGLVLFTRRRRPVSPVEVAALFLPMILLLTSNHQYYYVFTLVPVTVLFLRAVAARQWGVLGVVVTAYLMMSAPFRFTWIDRAGWFPVPFYYLINYSNVMVYGAFLLWGTATYQMFSEPRDPSVDGQPWSFRKRLVLVGVPVALSIAVSSVAVVRAQRRNTTVIPTAVVTMQPPLDASAPTSMALSPDGTRIAYVTQGRKLCVGPVGQPASTCWSGAEVGFPSGPFFSADGKWIGYFSRGELRKVPSSGGPVTGINGAPIGETASWSKDDTILLASNEGIFEMPAAGGSAVMVIRQREDEGRYLSPVRAGADVVVYAVAPVREEAGQQLGLHGGGRGAGKIVAESLRSGRREVLVSGSQPHVDATTGQLMYVSGPSVFAIPFHPESLEVSDLATPVISDVEVTAESGAIFDVSANGTLVYLPAGSIAGARRVLEWVDRTGVVTPFAVPPQAFETPRLSPDGKLLAVTVRDIQTDVWVYDVGSQHGSRISTEANRNETPVWFGDGRTVVFASGGLPRNLPSVSSSRVEDGGRLASVLWAARNSERFPGLRLSSASTTGGVVVGTLGDDLWWLDVAHDSKTSQVHAADRGPNLTVYMRTPAISPDGRWIAYTSDRTKKPEVYIASFPAMNDPRVVSTNGGFEPVWSSDGRELFYRGWVPPGNFIGLFAVPVNLSAGAALGVPKSLFADNHWQDNPSGTSYAVRADGQSFVMIREDAPTMAGTLRVVPRWFTRLPR